MPRKRVSRKRKASNLTEFQFWDLWLGHGRYDPRDFHATFKDEADRRRVWEENKAAIMKEWVENEYPGERPGAWWTYDAPERIPPEELRDREAQDKVLAEMGITSALGG